MQRGWGLMVIVGVGAGLAPRTTSAKPSDPPPTDEAQQALDKGIAQLKRGDPDSAIQSLEHAIELRETLPALYHLGLAYHRAHRKKDALATLERFVAGSIAAHQTAHVEEAEKLAQVLRSTTARVSLRVSGGAEKIFLDGKPIGHRDGHYGIVLDPGEHDLEAWGPDVDPGRVHLRLQPGARIDVKLDLTKNVPPPPKPIPAPPPAPIIVAGTSQPA